MNENKVEIQIKKFDAQKAIRLAKKIKRSEIQNRKQYVKELSQILLENNIENEITNLYNILSNIKR